MFQNALGDSTWKKGLNRYLAARGYNFATPDDLYAGLQEAVDEDNLVMNRPNVAAIMKTWETQSGFPYVTVTRNGNSLTFEQNRFMYANRTSTNLWWIPINYVVGSNANFESSKPDFWLQGVKSLTLQASELPKEFAANDWIVVNIQQSGYYRVNYDTASWRLIIQQLNRDGDEYAKIHVFNRAQLIDDSYHLARAGLNTYNNVFAIMDYLEKEVEYVPWASADNVVVLLNRWLSGSSAYANFQEFMRKNIQALYLRLGVNPIANEARVDVYARMIAINIACEAQHELCLTQVNQRLQQELYSEIPVTSDYVRVIYCNGVRKADSALFTSLRNKMTASSVSSERNTILTALGCVQDPAILTSYLAFAVNAGSDLTASERSRILSSPINNGEQSVLTLIEFTRTNYQSINFYNLVSSVCSNIAARVSNQEMMDSFSSLLTSLQGAGILSEAQTANYKNNANTIMNWQAANLRSVELFFRGEEDTTTSTTPVPTTPAPTTTTNSPTTPSQGTTESTTLGAGNIALSAIILTFSIFIKFLL
jgi:aminopeptidase N